MAEVERDALRSSSPTSLLKQGQLEQVAHDHVQLGFECLHRWRFYNLSRQAVPVFDHPQSKESSFIHSDGIPRDSLFLL